jgi:iron complex transport system substrate-binding protein
VSHPFPSEQEKEMAHEGTKATKDLVAENAVHRIVDLAVKLHKGLGPGLLESVYESVLARDLARQGLHVERQRVVSFEYDGMLFRDALRVDLLVEDVVVVEIKSSEHHSPVFFKQTLTYLRLLDLSLGLLINFGLPTLRQGLHRVVNGYGPSVPLCLRANPVETGRPDRLDR